MVAEITTQRKKAGKNCCGFSFKRSDPERDEEAEEKETEKNDGLILQEESDGSMRRRGIAPGKKERGAVVGPRVKEKEKEGGSSPFLEDDSDTELQVLVSSDCEYE